MRYLLILIILFWTNFVHATNYYFSDVSGNDSRTSTQAQNPATPWKSLTKLNSFFSSLVAGDSVLFKRGETFYGSIVVAASGNSGNLIKLGAYGTGSKPVITGFASVNSWTSLGGNIWESSNAVSTLSTCNIISINSMNVAMGRLPKTGYYNIASVTSNSITDGTNLNASVTNWTGAQVVMRKYRWILDKYTIASASGSTINFTNSGDALRAGWGYFIQNDSRACTVQNEWAYTSAKKIRIYSTSSPTSVKVPDIEEAVNLDGENYISFSNISFEGYNSTGINTASSISGIGIQVKDCDFIFIGVNAIYGYPNSQNLRVTGSSFIDINSRGIYAGSSSNAFINTNSLLRIGHFAGMGSNGDDSYTAIISNGDNAEVSYNTILNAGYVGIRWDGNATVIKNNFVNTTNYIKDDGGGIYCYPNQLGPVAQSFDTRTVRDNIVINSVGAIAGGTASSNASEGMGIYADGTSPNIRFINNTISGARLGLFLNGSHEVTAIGNKIFDCDRGLYLINYNPAIGIDNDSIINNIFVAKTIGQYAAYYEPGGANMPESFVASGNCYARPIDDNLTIWRDASGTNYYNTITQWKTYSGQDNDVVKAYKSISTISDVQLVYNQTSSTKPISFQGVWADIKTAQPYSGSITLPAYGSAILLRSTTPPLPITTVFLMAKADGSQFSWQSTDEENLAYYIVEESADNGKTWKEVVKTAAVGPSKYLVKP